MLHTQRERYKYTYISYDLHANVDNIFFYFIFCFYLLLFFTASSCWCCGCCCWSLNTKTTTKISHNWNWIESHTDRACIRSVNCLRLFRNNTDFILLEYDYHRTKSLAIHILFTCIMCTNIYLSISLYVCSSTYRYSMYRVREWVCVCVALKHSLENITVCIYTYQMNTKKNTNERTNQRKKERKKKT